MYDVVRRTAEQIFMPLTVGGGVGPSATSTRCCARALNKVSLNTAAIARPELLNEAATQFGAQCVVLSVDARRVKQGSPPTLTGFEARRTAAGKRRSGIDVVDWARCAAELGAGRSCSTRWTSPTGTMRASTWS